MKKEKEKGRKERRKEREKKGRRPSLFLGFTRDHGAQALLVHVYPAVFTVVSAPGQAPDEVLALGTVGWRRELNDLKDMTRLGLFWQGRG